MAGAQPSNMQPYLQPENPVTRNPLEEKATKHLERHDQPDAAAAATTTATSRQQPGDALPSALGHGVRGGSGPVDAQEAKATSRGHEERGSEQQQQQQQLQNENVNADEQLATLAEGKVADAVQRKSGTQKVPGSGPAEEQDFASDLDRKKAEQAAAREEIKEARNAGVDVDGGASGRVGDETLYHA